MGQKNRPLREGRGVRSEAQQQPAPGGADKAQEIKRYVRPFYVEVGFVCLDALAGRITHSSKLERLITPSSTLERLQDDGGKGLTVLGRALSASVRSLARAAPFASCSAARQRLSRLRSCADHAYMVVCLAGGLSRAQACS